MAYRIVDFSDIVDAVVAELKHDSNDTAETNRIKRDINTIYMDEVVPAKRWHWLRGHTTLRLAPFYADGTVTVTPDSTTITFTVAPETSKTGYLFAVDGFNEIFTIDSHTAGATTATLNMAYSGTLNYTAGYKIWNYKLDLPTDCRETLEVWHDHFSKPMEGIGLQDFRKTVAENPRQDGRPYYYCTNTFTGTDEDDRFRQLYVYPAINQYSSTLHVDYIKEVSALDADGDEPLLPVEDRVVLVYGALEMAWMRARNENAAQLSRLKFDRKLAAMMGKVEDSQDKPQITPSSQYLARKRARAILPTSRVNAFSSGGSYTAPSYLKNATIEGANITANVTVSPGVTVDGRDISADGALLDSHVADTIDAHDASAISVVPSGNLAADDVQEALVELQTDVDTRTLDSDFDAHLGDATGAHEATAISVSPAGNLAANDVQEALEELQTDVDTRALDADLDAHVNDTTGAHAASAISNTPSGNLAATDVQTALNELQTDADGRVLKAGDTMTGTLTLPAGSTATPAINFTGDTNSGFYHKGAGNIAFVTDELTGIELKTATSGNYSNVALGGSVSTSDSFPLLLERSLANTVAVQVTNANGGAAASSKFALKAGTGAVMGAELAAHPAAATTNAYTNRAVMRSTGSAVGVSVVAGENTTDTIKMYVGGYTAADETLRFNPDQTIEFPNSASSPSAPSAGVKLYEASGKLFAKNSGGTEYDLTAGSSGQLYAYVSKSADYTLTGGDTVVAVTAASIMTLPTAVGATGKHYIIINKSTSAANVTIATTSSQTIGGRASSDIVLRRFNNYVWVMSNGSNWEILGKAEHEVKQAASGSQAVSGVSGSFAANHAQITLGIGIWDVEGNFAVSTGSTASVFALYGSSGFYGADGANNTSTPTAVAAQTDGPLTYNAWFSTYNIHPAVSGTWHFGCYPLRTRIIVTSGTQTVFFVPNFTYSVAGTSFIASQIRAHRVF